ncbi:AraC family transcriptional regulator [Asanoa sp. WMMD1127]|uniref:AraC family transcriptional regulator n=1 Tax=Asanoa sp. WMMD1127 TaxID=3016107 RepID=UPI0024173EBA|nr:AraC family transcriptional regulator [Asanoa sp. WMMD1127]MDG4825872.1 AraC family transcriptional regulator [Asanoa sp. WMMD1127]
MDPLGDLLDGVRARSAAFCQAVLEPPWALRIADRAPLALATPLRGHAWVVPDGAEPTLVHTGDVVIVRGPEPYTVADRPDTRPSLVVHPDNRLTDEDGQDVTAAFRLSTNTSALGPRAGPAARAPHTQSVVASGTYQVSAHVNRRLLDTLPTVLRVPREDVRSEPVLDLLAAEVSRDEPGQQVVLDRLLDLALVATLRAWFARPGADPPGWYKAHGDPLVGPALRVIHDDPARPWTVATLAAATGASRAAFARRFTALVGQPPMTYLTHWRLDLAAEALRNTDATVSAIAREVGYANAFALSVAFKRVRGATPRQHRAAPSAQQRGTPGMNPL